MSVSESETKSHKHTRPHFINIIDINLHPALNFSLQSGLADSVEVYKLCLC